MKSQIKLMTVVLAVNLFNVFANGPRGQFHDKAIKVIDGKAFDIPIFPGVSKVRGHKDCSYNKPVCGQLIVYNVNATMQQIKQFYFQQTIVGAKIGQFSKYGFRQCKKGESEINIILHDNKNGEITVQIKTPCNQKIYDKYK